MFWEIPGHHMPCFALSRHLVTPWCPWCIFVNRSGHSFVGMTMRQSRSSKPLATLSSSQAPWYGRASVITYLRPRGQPVRVYFIMICSLMSFYVACFISASLLSVIGRDAWMLCTYDAISSLNVESVFLFGFLDNASATTNEWPRTHQMAAWSNISPSHKPLRVHLRFLLWNRWIIINRL